MFSDRIAVLLVEDNPGDCLLIRSMLDEVAGQSLALVCAGCLSAAVDRLESRSFDVVLLDLSLPDSQRLAGYRKLRDRYPALPIVVLTGLDDQQLALRALGEGAQDYLVKGQIDGPLLVRSVRYAIERRKTQLALEQARSELEHRVRQRTAELESACRQLQAEMAERQAAQEQERRHREELAHLARLGTMGEMATTLAHEINQPLTAIIGYAKSCLRRLRSGQYEVDDLEDLLSKAAAEAMHAGQIVKRLRGLVRKRTAERSCFDIRDAIGEVQAMADAEARSAGVTIRLDAAQPLPSVFADRIQIQQVLLNLLRNAIEAMQAEGAGRRLDVDVRLKDARAVEIAVSDMGRGGRIESLERLFEPFWSTKPEGIGMGLAISRTIVEAHGGRLTADRNPAGGLTFRFTLPTDAPPAGQTSHGEPTRGADAPGERGTQR